MADQTFTDGLGNEITLTENVRSTTLTKHPEANDFVDALSRVLGNPDQIRASSRDERVVLYYRFESEILNGKWIVVVVKRVEQHFVSTFYATDKIKSGDVLWTK